MAALTRTDSQICLFGMRATALFILFMANFGCSRVTELTHSITNSISSAVANTLPNKSSSVVTTTSYSDDEGDFDALLLESIKPNASTEDWMLKHFGDAATATKIENDMALLSWPFNVEIKKRKKVLRYFGSTHAAQTPMFLHVVVDQSLVRAVWVNDRPQPKEDEALKALAHPQTLVLSELSTGSKTKAKAPTVSINSASQPIIPDTPAAQAPDVQTPIAQTPNAQTSAPQPDQPTSDLIKSENKESAPAKSESTDEKMDDDLAKEMGNLKSK